MERASKIMYFKGGDWLLYHNSNCRPPKLLGRNVRYVATPIVPAARFYLVEDVA